MLDNLNWETSPFPHVIIDDFFEHEVACQLEAEFPPYNDPSWYVYNNALEKKKTQNLWRMFPPTTYQIFQALCMKTINGTVADYGLHGGGWHIHQNGGNLNPHLDYIMHPKLGTQRQYNLIVYLSRDFKPEYGGNLGFWYGDKEKPHQLAKEIEPKFNRAVLFDTTQNSWHGLVTSISCPEGVYRKSIAIYFLSGVPQETRDRALFAPRPEQVGNAEIEALIHRRLSGNYQ